MGLSQADIQRIAGFVRKVTKAPDVEAIISETFTTLKAMADIDRVRIVYSPLPSRWTEWKASENGLEVRSSEEWPAPERKSVTVHFDPENDHSGFISALNFSFSIRAKVAHRGVGKKSGPSRSANRFIVGLKPPFRLYVASAIRISPVPKMVTES